MKFMFLGILAISLTCICSASATNCTYGVTSTICQNGTFFSSHKQICELCKQCKVGYGVRCHCKYDQNIKCERCSKGTYSKLLAGNRYCTPCTNCRSYEIQARACNMTDDAKCDMKNKKKGLSVNHSTYQVIIAVLTALVMASICAIIFLIIYIKKKRNRNSRETDPSLASEAHLFDGSSFSSLEDTRFRKDRLKNERSSFSSLEDSRWRRDRPKEDRDSIQSSLLSSDNCSGSERSTFRTLRNPDVLLNSLPASVFQNLGKLLNPSNAYRDWQTLAGRIGKTQMDIENIKVTGSYDYVERLLLNWYSSNPDVTIGDLYKKLVEISREDAASVLYQYDKQLRAETPV